MKFLIRVLCVCVLTCWASSVFGQALSTAQVNGTVTDSSGAAIPGAEVKATQTATGAVRSVQSGADGGFVLPNLAIGPYMIEVVKEGFSRSVETGIVLQVDSNPTIDIAMKVGAVSEQVTVEAAAAQLETHSNNIGQIVDNKRVAEMPLNGRNPIELVFLAGMASSPGDGAINTVRNYPTVVVSVAGGQGNGLGYNLDGAIFQDPYNNLALPLPFPDALQEFRVKALKGFGCNAYRTSHNPPTPELLDACDRLGLVGLQSCDCSCWQHVHPEQVCRGSLPNTLSNLRFAIPRLHR